MMDPEALAALGVFLLTGFVMDGFAMGQVENNLVLLAPAEGRRGWRAGCVSTPMAPAIEAGLNPSGG
jgi:hypothetical protein